MTRKPGHPFANDPVLTRERVDAIIRGYKLRGATFKGATVAAGISDRTGKKWLARGREDFDAGEDSLHAHLYREIETIRARRVRRLYKLSLSGDGPTAASARWWAERLDPESLNLAAKHEVSGPEGGAISLDVTADALCDKLEALARRRAVGDGRGDASDGAAGDEPRGTDGAGARDRG